MSHNDHSMRTPMGKVRYLGSAKSGTTHVWHQRLTAYALLPLSIRFVILILSLIGKDYNSARAILAAPYVSILILLFIGSGIYHMQLGMRVIIEDYVHAHGSKTALLVANTFFSVCIGISAAYAVLKLSLA